MLPAILKQWFDVVLSYQFAYGPDGDKTKNKNLIPSFTVGSVESKYGPSGDHRFRIDEFCKSLEQSAYFMKMNYIDPICFHGTFLSAEVTEEQVRSRARKHAERLITRLMILNDSTQA